MPVNVADLVVTIQADVAELKVALGQIEENTKKTESAFTSSLSSLTAFAAGYLSLNKGIEILKESVAIAIESEKQTTLLQASVQAAGISWAAYGDDISKAVKATSNYALVSEKDVQSALRRLVTVTNDVSGSTKNLSLVFDLVRNRGFGVEQAALVIGKAMEGDIAVLGRYLPDIKELNALMGSNANDTEKAARAISILEQRIGGQGSKFGEAERAVREYNKSIEETGRIIGNLLKPAITTTSNVLGEGLLLLYDWDTAIKKINTDSKSGGSSLKSIVDPSYLQLLKNVKDAIVSLFTGVDTEPLLGAIESTHVSLVTSLDAAQQLAKALNQEIDPAKGVEEWLTKAGAAQLALGKAITNQGVTDYYNRINIGLYEFTARTDAGAAAQQKLGMAAHDTALTTYYIDVNKGLFQVTAETDAAAMAQKRLGEAAVDAATRIYNGTTKSVTDMERAMTLESMTESERRQAIIAFEYSDRIKEILAMKLTVDKTEQLITLATTAEEAKRLAIAQQAHEVMVQQVQDYAMAFYQAYVTTAQTHKNFTDIMVKGTLEGMRAILNMIIQMLIKKIIAEQLADVAIASMEGFVTFGASLLEIAPIIAVAGAAMGALNAIKLAEGGIVTRPTLAMIGEAGPEVVIPLSHSLNSLNFGGAGPESVMSISHGFGQSIVIKPAPVILSGRHIADVIFEQEMPRKMRQQGIGK